MSATANQCKLQEYFNSYYGLPDKTHEGAQLITINGTAKYPITKYYLDDLYGHIESVSINDFYKYIIFYIHSFIITSVCIFTFLSLNNVKI